MEAILFVKTSSLKIKSIQMNEVAAILPGELLGLGKKLSSNSFSPERFGDPERANEAPFQ